MRASGKPKVKEAFAGDLREILPALFFHDGERQSCAQVTDDGHQRNKRCLSSDVNCVYYGLKSCIFVEVDDLWILGSTHQPDELKTMITYSKSFGGEKDENTGYKCHPIGIITSFTHPRPVLYRE
jgi:hypothetical protein